MATAAAPSTPPTTNNSSFPLLLHPAVNLAHDRLHDPINTARLQTVHVFDFDQTLFHSPLPNPVLWEPSFINRLISWNNCHSGWWHNSATLDLGPEAEASAWDGWWNEDLIKDVEASTRNPECLTILLTGRNGPVYSDQILRMVKAKGLDFDLIATKPTTAILLESSNMSQKESANKDQMESSSKNQKESSNKNQKESFNKNQKEVYRKIHTFSIKHEFLYNVLFEYPSIRHMRVWDDRIEQITKFRRAGADWIQRKMLDTFELTEVNLPPRYMDHEREKALVLAMVAAHNQQVGVESRGGPMMVSGVAPMPPDRPELKDFDIWEPYVTYIPQRRALIEMVRLVRYTCVTFSASIQSFLEGFARGGSRETNMIKTPSSLEGRDLTSWVVPDELHVTLCLGVAPEDYLAAIGGLGATVFVEIEAVGEADGNIWALKVNGVDTLVDSENQIIIAPNGIHYSTFDAFFSGCKRNGSTTIDIGTQPLGHLRLRKEGVPHITMAYDRIQGSRPVAASKITVWEPITSTKGARRIILVGTIGEKQLYGIKSQNLGHLAVVHRAEVSIAELVKKCASERSLKISGKQLGSAIKEIKKEMERLSIENKAHNTATITTLVNGVCDKEFD